MSKKKFTCISCPIGCSLNVEIVDGKIKEITGNKCARGQTYAENEVYDPKRTLTSTVKILGGTIEQLPVRTLDPIPKGKLKEAMLFLKTFTAKAPVRVGDTIVDDFLQTGVPLIATRTVNTDSQ